MGMLLLLIVLVLPTAGKDHSGVRFTETFDGRYPITGVESALRGVFLSIKERTKLFCASMVECMLPADSSRVSNHPDAVVLIVINERETSQ